MPETHNGTTLKQMTYNGQKLKKWKHNGILVYSAGNIVTYYVNGVFYQEEVESGKSVLSPTTFTPSKTGYTFLGWSLSEGGTVLSECVMDSEPITLYAVWKANDIILVSNYATQNGYGFAGSGSSPLPGESSWGSFGNLLIKSTRGTYGYTRGFLNKAIDLTDYKTITFNILFRLGFGYSGISTIGGFYVGYANSTTVNSASGASRSYNQSPFESSMTFNVDISKVTGEKYVGVVVWAGSYEGDDEWVDGWNQMKVSSIVLKG